MNIELNLRDRLSWEMLTLHGVLHVDITAIERTDLT